MASLRPTNTTSLGRDVLNLHALEQDERKTATILFADIVGSTPLVSRRDPEAALDILRPALTSPFRSGTPLRRDGEPGHRRRHNGSVWCSLLR